MKNYNSIYIAENDIEVISIAPVQNRNENQMYVQNNQQSMFEEDSMFQPQPEQQAYSSTPNYYQNTQTEMPQTNNKPTESQFIFKKVLTSFGVMLLCILLILALVILYKKYFLNLPIQEQSKPQQQPQAKPIENIQENQINQETAEVAQQEPEKIVFRPQKKTKISKLSTPSSVTKCIRAFLENTKTK